VILHLLNIFIYIDEKEIPPGDIFYSITEKEWGKIRTLDDKNILKVLEILKYTNGAIIA
jgi:hypothetical protein